MCKEQSKSALVQVKLRAYTGFGLPSFAFIVQKNSFFREKKKKFSCYSSIL
jgi:hypothetical protein